MGSPPTYDGSKYRWSRLQSVFFDQHFTISQKWCKIGTWLAFYGTLIGTRVRIVSYRIFTFNFHLWPLSANSPPLSLSKMSSLYSLDQGLLLFEKPESDRLTLLFSKDVIHRKFIFFFIQFMLHNFDQIGCPALNILQKLNIFSQIRRPNRHTVL